MVGFHDRESPGPDRSRQVALEVWPHLGCRDKSQSRPIAIQRRVANAPPDLEPERSPVADPKTPTHSGNSIGTNPNTSCKQKSNEPTSVPWLARKLTWRHHAAESPPQDWRTPWESVLAVEGGGAFPHLPRPGQQASRGSFQIVSMIFVNTSGPGRNVSWVRRESGVSTVFSVARKSGRFVST